MKKMLALICFVTLNLTASSAPPDAPKQEYPKQEGTGDGGSKSRPSQGSKEATQISSRGSTYPTSRVAPVALPASTTSRYASVTRRVNLRRPTATATTKPAVAPVGGSSSAL